MTARNMARTDETIAAYINLCAAIKSPSMRLIMRLDGMGCLIENN